MVARKFKNKKDDTMPPQKLYRNPPVSTLSHDFSWGCSTCLHWTGVATPEENTMNKQQEGKPRSQPFPAAVLVSAPRNTSWTVKIQTSEERKVGKNALHGTHWTIILLQFNLPFTSQSLENTEAWNRQNCLGMEQNFGLQPAPTLSTNTQQQQDKASLWQK